MAIKSFVDYLKNDYDLEDLCLHDSVISKNLQFCSDGMQIVINITLSRQEQHLEAIEFLRRVADELVALERAARWAAPSE
jgi:hypothetical protein